MTKKAGKATTGGKQLSKGAQGSSQTRRARFRINSPLDTNSSGDDEPKTNNAKGHESRMSGTVMR